MRRLLAVVGIAGVAYGCTLLVPSDVEQCRVDGDCTNRGASFVNTRCVSNVCVSGADGGGGDAAPDGPSDPKWGCLGNVTWGKQDVSQKVWLRSRYVKLISEDSVTAMTVTACNRLDPTCASPITTATTDVDGYVNLQLPKFFEGSLYLAPPTTFPDMVPSIEMVIPPPEKDQSLDASIPTNIAAHLASAAELNYLLAQIQSSLDPNLGHVLGIVLDCQGNPTSGVTLRINPKDKSTIQYYTDTTGVPSVTANETAQRGEAGFVNAPTGAVTIEATVNALSRKMGTYTAIVKAGNITYLPMSPAPN